MVDLLGYQCFSDQGIFHERFSSFIPGSKDLRSVFLEFSTVTEDDLPGGSGLSVLIKPLLFQSTAS